MVPSIHPHPRLIPVSAVPWLLLSVSVVLWRILLLRRHLLGGILLLLLRWVLLLRRHLLRWRLVVLLLRWVLLRRRWGHGCRLVVRILLALGGPRAVSVGRTVAAPTTASSSGSLLRQEDPSDAFVDGFQLGQVGRRNLDGVARHRQTHDVLPRVQLVLVLDHLRSLPVVLDSSPLQRKLLDLDGHGTSGLCFDDRNVVLGLASVHIHHPRLGDNSTNDNVLWFPVLGRVWCRCFFGVVFHHVFSLGHDNVGVGDVKQQRQRTRSFLDQPGCFLRVSHVDTVHLQEDVSQFDTGRSGRRSFHDEGYHGTLVQSVDDVSVRVQKERIGQFLGLEEHDTQGRGENTRIVKFSAGGEVALLFLFLNRVLRPGGGRGIESEVAPQISVRRWLWRRLRRNEGVVVDGSRRRRGRRCGSRIEDRKGIGCLGWWYRRQLLLLLGRKGLGVGIALCVRHDQRSHARIRRRRRLLLLLWRTKGIGVRRRELLLWRRGTGWRTGWRTVDVWCSGCGPVGVGWLGLGRKASVGRSTTGWCGGGPERVACSQDRCRGSSAVGIGRLGRGGSGRHRSGRGSVGIGRRGGSRSYRQGRTGVSTVRIGRCRGRSRGTGGRWHCHGCRSVSTKGVGSSNGWWLLLLRRCRSGLAIHATHAHRTHWRWLVLLWRLSHHAHLWLLLMMLRWSLERIHHRSVVRGRSWSRSIGKDRPEGIARVGRRWSSTRGQCGLNVHRELVEWIAHGSLFRSTT
mmetsp:Transcript_29692/g.63604  ORF Transcript_29692/g.63604 Transcript_29692/m.63604 type:complete len:737 (-) Transcript_29692:91-2301(-)